jgi:hypothetical protein
MALTATTRAAAGLGSVTRSSSTHPCVAARPSRPTLRSPVVAAAGPDASSPADAAAAPPAAAAAVSRRAAALFGAAAVGAALSPAAAPSPARADSEYATFLGYATPPTSYGGYGGNANEPRESFFFLPLSLSFSSLSPPPPPLLSSRPFLLLPKQHPKQPNQPHPNNNQNKTAKYTFEYPASWKQEVPSKVEKGTQGVDGRVAAPGRAGKDFRAFVITLGRAGEDNKSFKLTEDRESAFASFAGADYDLQVRGGPDFCCALLPTTEKREKNAHEKKQNKN